MPVQYDDPLPAETEMIATAEATTPDRSFETSGWIVVVLPDTKEVQDVEVDITDLNTLLESKKVGKPSAAKNLPKVAQNWIKDLAREGLVTVYDTTSTLGTIGGDQVVQVSLDQGLKLLSVEKSSGTDEDLGKEENEGDKDGEDDVTNDK